MPAGENANSARKMAYVERLEGVLRDYSRVMVVGADNIGSSHMQNIRADLRDDAELVMGKNTLMRRAIRAVGAENKALLQLLPHVQRNVGLLFTNKDLAFVRGKVLANTKGAPAKAGAVAPCDVIVPPGNTGLEPTQTQFLQALNIATKISRGQIEILKPVDLIKTGERVSPSQATLLSKLKISPFKYGLSVKSVYDDGFMFDPDVLDLTDEDLLNKLSAGVRNVACLSLAIGFPTLASVPHSIANGFKNVLALSLETEYTVEAAAPIKAFLADPEAALAAIQASAPAASADAGGDDAAAEEEEEEESDDDMGFGLFD